jgi:hypothetical protein
MTSPSLSPFRFLALLASWRFSPPLLARQHSTEIVHFQTISRRCQEISVYYRTSAVRRSALTTPGWVPWSMNSAVRSAVAGPMPMPPPVKPTAK